MKRDKQDVAILILGVLVAVLLIALIVINVFDLKIGQTEALKPSETVPPGEDMQQGFQFSDTPEIILGSGDTQGRDEMSDVSTSDGSVAMSLVTGSFAQRGGPAFSLYVDTETFQMTELDGHCYFSLSGDAGASFYLEVAYHDSADAQALADTLLNDYGIIAEAQNNGTVSLGNYEAINVQGSALETRLDAYLIQTANGCITLVLCTPGNANATYTANLHASMETLALTEN